MHQRHPERHPSRQANFGDHDSLAPADLLSSPERAAYLQSVQRKASGPLPQSPGVDELLSQSADRQPSPSEQVQNIADQGVKGPGQKLPHLDKLQPLFGHHDLSGVEAHVGGAAAQASTALFAHGYATGNKVAFKQDPDLRLAAHEATHVVQQRAGVHLFNGKFHGGDPQEQQADAVADQVASGQSASGMLDQISGQTTGQPQAAAMVAASDPGAVTAAPPSLAAADAGPTATPQTTTAAPTPAAAAAPQAAAPAPADGPTQDVAVTPAEPTLTLGASGPQVKKLQEELNARGVEPPLGVDGSFGGRTQAAVQWFQEHNGLKTSGVVDQDTWNALGLAAAKPTLDPTDTALGENVAERMDSANTGPYGLDVGIHYSYNFEYECNQAGKPQLWKDDYRMGFADPTYFDRQGFMDWKLKSGMSASAAIKSWLRGLTVAECNSSAVAMEIDSLRGAIGDTKFDAMFGSTDSQVADDKLLRVKPGTEGTPVAQFMKMPDLTKEKMEKDAAGEKLTDEEFDSAIHRGEWYYFYNHPKYLLKHPGGAWQGENSIYMGKHNGVRVWSGLGASNVTEEGMYAEMVEAYNAPRDKEDERALRDQNIKNADGTYTNAAWDPKSGEFPDKVTKDAILNDPAFTINGVTRKGGFDFEAGETLDSAKVKALRDGEKSA